MSRRAAWRNIVLGAVGLVLLAGVLRGGDRHVDASAGRIYTLSSVTRDLVAHLNDDVTIEVFYAGGQPGYADVADLVRRIADAGGTITVRFENPDGPRALNLLVASGAVAVSRPSGRPVVVRNPDEADLVGAIAEAADLPFHPFAPNVAPTQPMFPTALGRQLLWLLPTVVAPLGAAFAGFFVTWRRRVTSR